MKRNRQWHTEAELFRDLAQKEREGSVRAVNVLEPHAYRVAIEALGFPKPCSKTLHRRYLERVDRNTGELVQETCKGKIQGFFFLFRSDSF